jgi:hypothetical protein
MINWKKDQKTTKANPGEPITGNYGFKKNNEMAKKKRGPRQRSEKSLIALLNRREPKEGHSVISLIYPGESKWAVGVKCSCGKEHPLHNGFRVNWEKEEGNLKKLSLALGIGVEISWYKLDMEGKLGHF